MESWYLERDTGAIYALHVRTRLNVRMRVKERKRTAGKGALSTGTASPVRGWWLRGTTLGKRRHTGARSSSPDEGDSASMVRGLGSDAWCAAKG